LRGIRDPSEPLDRTLLAFVTHPGFKSHAAARGGEHFNTRVAYLESPEPPRVQIGDSSWDRHMVTYAASGSEAARAFPAAVREKLSVWRFSGHLEVRPGGMILHFAGLKPSPDGYERLLRGIPELVHTWLTK
jgi:hypothetical protein